MQDLIVIYNMLERDYIIYFFLLQKKMPIKSISDLEKEIEELERLETAGLLEEGGDVLSSFSFSDLSSLVFFVRNFHSCYHFLFSFSCQ
jgi:hypothetical protein